MAKALPSKSFELEFINDGHAKVCFNGNEIPVDEIEITRLANNNGLVRFREVRHVDEVKIIGEPSGNYLNVEKSIEGGYETIKVTLNKES